MIQAFLRWLLPKPWFDAIEAESRTWFLLCRCGYEWSVWDAGGVRYKAIAHHKRVLARCPVCKKTGMMRLKRAG